MGHQSGNLRWDFVIHAVGPIHGVRGRNQNKDNELYSAAFESLDEANKQGLRSVALPALSTGIFNFPLNRATKLICEATLDYLMENSTTVKEVSLIDVLPETVTSFKQSLVELIKTRNIKSTSVSGDHQKPKPRNIGKKDYQGMVILWFLQLHQTLYEIQYILIQY